MQAGVARGVTVKVYRAATSLSLQAPWINGRPDGRRDIQKAGVGILLPLTNVKLFLKWASPNLHLI